MDLVPFTPQCPWPLEEVSVATARTPGGQRGRGLDASLTKTHLVPTEESNYSSVGGRVASLFSVLIGIHTFGWGMLAPQGGMVPLRYSSTANLWCGYSTYLVNISPRRLTP